MNVDRWTAYVAVFLVGVMAGLVLAGMIGG